MTPLELRPLAIGELLDRVFTLYRRHLSTFVGIMAIPSIFNLALALAIRTAQYLGAPIFTPRTAPFDDATFGSPEMLLNLVGLVVGAILFLAAYWVAYMLALGATTFAVSEIYAGRDTNISSAFARARQQAGRLMLLALLWLVFIMGPAVLVLVACGGLVVVARVAFGPVWQTGVLAVLFFAIGMLGFLVVCVWLSLRYALSGPAVIIEGATARESLRRSVFLSRGYLGRVFLLTLCAMMLAYTSLMIFQVPFTIASALIGKNTPTAFWIDMAGAVSGTIGQTLVAPVMVIGVAVLYYDLRVRKEALDLQSMMSALDAAADGRTFVTAPASPAFPDRS